MEEYVKKGVRLYSLTNKDIDGVALSIAMFRAPGARNQAISARIRARCCKFFLKKMKSATRAKIAADGTEEDCITS